MWNETNIRKWIASSCALAVLLFAATALAQDKTGDVVIGGDREIYSEILGEKRILRIRFPADYQDSETRYHVIYILDAEWDELFNHVVETVAIFAATGTAPDMIVVGIRNTERNRDMIPAVVAERPGSGGGEKFLQFFAEELIPYMNDNYRTNSENIIYGGSNAGLFVVFAILERPVLFTAAIASSPMIGHCPEFMYGVADNLDDGEGFDNRILYMIYGKDDYTKCTDYMPEFQSYLQEKDAGGFRSELVMLEGEGHVPSNSFYNGIKFVLSRR